VTAVRRIRRLYAGADLTTSQGWDAYARRYKGERLGDEWNRPDVEGLDVSADGYVAHLDSVVFAPFLGHVGTLLEIGPGGGRFSEVLLTHCDHLIAADTSRSMLDLLRGRFTAQRNISYVHLDGLGLRQIGTCSVDAAFSYGVFVHLQHWDIYNYLVEIERVLRPGGNALIQHSSTLSEQGWQYFLREVPGQLNRHKLFGTYTVMTPELMAEFARRAGLKPLGCRTDVVRTEAISLLQKAAATSDGQAD